MNNQHLCNGIVSFSTPEQEIYLRSPISNRDNLSFKNVVNIKGLDVPFISSYDYSGFYDSFTKGVVVNKALPEGYFVTSSFSLAEEILLKSSDEQIVRIVDGNGNHIELNKKTLTSIYQFYKAFRETGDLLFIETAFMGVKHLNGKKLFLDFASATFPAIEASAFITRLEADSYLPFGRKFTNQISGTKQDSQNNIKTSFYYDDKQKFTIVAQRLVESDDCPLVFLKIKDDSHILLERGRYPDLFEKFHDSVETVGLSIITLPDKVYHYMIFKNFHNGNKEVMTIVQHGIPTFSHVDILRILGTHPSYKK